MLLNAVDQLLMGMNVHVYFIFLSDVLMSLILNFMLLK